MVKEIIDFTGLEFDREVKRVKVEKPRQEESKERIRREKPGLARNLRNLFTTFLG